jgi:hypothetical protein
MGFAKTYMSTVRVMNLSCFGEYCRNTTYKFYGSIRDHNSVRHNHGDCNRCFSCSSIGGYASLGSRLCNPISYNFDSSRNICTASSILKFSSTINLHVECKCSKASVKQSSSVVQTTQSTSFLQPLAKIQTLCS